MTAAFVVVDPAGADAIWAMTQYFNELDERFPDGFDPGDTLVADAHTMRTPTGAFLIAYDDGEIAACGGLLTIGDYTGEIKRIKRMAPYLKKYKANPPK